MLSCEPHKELSEPNLSIILIDTLRVARVTQDPVETEAAPRIILDEEGIDELRALGYVD